MIADDGEDTNDVFYYKQTTCVPIRMNVTSTPFRTRRPPCAEEDACSRCRGEGFKRRPSNNLPRAPADGLKGCMVSSTDIRSRLLRGQLGVPGGGGGRAARLRGSGGG